MQSKICSNELKLDLNSELRNIKNKEEQYTIPVFIPHKGCKNECVFCNQRKISGTIKNVSLDEVDNIIANHLAYFDNTSKRKKVQIAFFGGSFTGLEIYEQIEYLKIANKYIKNGKVDSIRISTRPDYISPKILKILKKYNVKNIELGVQCLDEKVLKLSKRGHSQNDVIRASRLIQLFGFTLGHQIMVGLPGSSSNTDIFTINKVIKLGAKELRIYPVYVIDPSELYDMYLRGKYKPLTLEEAVLRTVNIVNKCRKTDIKIIRLGLQSTDEITKNNKEIVGPVSDNLSEYVFAHIVRETIERHVNINNTKGCILKLIIPKRYISIAIGPNKINKKYFKEKYNIELKVEGD